MANVQEQFFVAWTNSDAVALLFAR